MRMMPPRAITPAQLGKLRNARQAKGIATISDKRTVTADNSAQQGA
jgi:hypothetical protein